MNAFVAALKRAVQEVFADRYALTTMIGAVILYSVFYPTAYRHEIAQDLPVAIVNQDNGPASRSVIHRIDALRAVRIAGIEPTVDSARRGVEQGRYEGIVFIPHGLERDLVRGETAHLIVFANGAFLSRGSNVLAAMGDVAGASAIEAIAQARQFERQSEAPPLVLIQRPLFNVREGYGSGVVPGVAEIIVHQTLLIGIGVILGGRRARNGGIRLSYTLSDWLGASAGFACIGVPSLLYYAGFTFWAQDYPRGGNFIALAVVGPLYIAATTAFGMFVGSFFTRREHAFQFIIGVSLVLFFLANLTWPITSTPTMLALLARLLPTTSGVTGLIKANQLGASVSETLPQIENLLILTIAYSCLSACRFRSNRLEPPNQVSSAVEISPHQEHP